MPPAWGLSPACGALSGSIGFTRRHKGGNKFVDHPIERRTFRRFLLSLPVLFRWTDTSEHYAVGQCRNAGRDGMFILTTKRPPVGMQVEIRLDIPAFHLIPQQWLRCTGRVTRVESRDGVRGFAVAGRIESEHLEGNQEGEDDAGEEEAGARSTLPTR